MSSEPRVQTAKSIKICLEYLLKDSEAADLPLVSLHLKIAIMEAEEILIEAAAGTREALDSDQ